MKNLFSVEPVNRGRQVELDLAKCSAIFFMIFLHCLMVTSGFANDISLFMQRGIAQLVGGPFAAPVFMFAMGVGIVYSRNQEPMYLIKRGFKLMLLGLVVNIGEFFLPHFLAGKLLGEWDIFPIAGGLLLFCVDILAFAGMAMMLIGVLKKMKLSPVMMVVVALVLSIIGSFVRFHDFGSNVPNLIAGYFIGSAGGFTAFPLFNWFIFPAAGIIFGQWYMRCCNKKKLLCLWPLGLAISVTYFVVSWFRPEGFLSETHHYYFMTTVDAMFCLINIYGVIGGCYFLSLVLSDPVKGFFSKISGDLNVIYVIQWFIIPLTYIFIVYFNRDIVFGDLSLVVIALLEIAASSALAAGYKNFRRKGRKRTMKLKARSIFVIVFTLMFATTMLFASSADPVIAADADDDSKDLTKKKMERLLMSESPETAAQIMEAAEDEDYGTEGLHKKASTFKRNFDLTPDQKEKVITKCNEVVETVLDENMSDLEKYYTLAKWTNKHVSYDYDFWNAGYDLNCYRHQWDAYGVMVEQNAVCVGIAIFYSNLCHAAGLPCKFVRVDPDKLDHTISYIPNINENAYYVDVTEDMLFMSEESNIFEPVDRNCEFAKVTERCKDGSFDYMPTSGGRWTPSAIKEYYDTPFSDWYDEYARHNNADKIFRETYTELGSGEKGKRYATYDQYPSNFTEKTGLWFMDDFYAFKSSEVETRDLSEIEGMIQNKKLDRQLLNVAGIKDNYDCTFDQLKTEIKADLAGSPVKFFPTADKEGNIVAESARLVPDEDYELTVNSIDDSRAEVKLTGKGQYSGEYTKAVGLKMAEVVKAPYPVKRNTDFGVENLEYNGTDQKLVLPGEAKNGQMQYALGNSGEPTGQFSTSIPTGKDAGNYFVWYKVVGDEGYADTQPLCMVSPIKIDPKQVYFEVTDITVRVGETVQVKPALNDKAASATFTFASKDTEIATINKKGELTGKKEGQVAIVIKARPNSNNFTVPDDEEVELYVGGVNDAPVELSKIYFTYNGKVQKPSIKTINGLKLESGTDYTATWSNQSSRNAGTYTITIKGMDRFTGTTEAAYMIDKAANPLKVKAKKKAVKIKKKTLKKKSKKIKRSRALTVSKAQGKVSYKLVSAKKGKKSFKKKFKVNAKTGKITVKKGLKKGTYKVKVKVRAAGNANYKASPWKKVTFKVKVR